MFRKKGWNFGVEIFRPANNAVPPMTIEAIR
jgi:hypothetical protein